MGGSSSLWKDQQDCQRYCDVVREAGTLSGGGEVVMFVVGDIVRGWGHCQGVIHYSVSLICKHV